jgi:hypothetical protein
MLTQSKKNIAGERGDVFSAARDDLAWNDGDWPFLHGELSGSARLAGSAEQEARNQIGSLRRTKSGRQCLDVTRLWRK